MIQLFREFLLNVPYENLKQPLILALKLNHE